MTEPPKDLRSHLRCTAIFTIVSVVYAFLFLGLMVYLGKSEIRGWPSFDLQLEMMPFTFFSALCEEAFFRLFPVALVIILAGRKQTAVLVGLTTVIALLFFAANGHYLPFVLKGFSIREARWLSFGLQGGLGVIWSLLFVKCARSEDWTQWRAWLCVSCSHFLYNVTVEEIFGNWFV